MRLQTCLFSLAVLALAAGCGKDDVPGPDAGKGAAAKPAVADTADVAVMALVEGLKADHPEAAWQFLPASYQRDINDLVHSFAERMDPELWNRTSGVLRKLAGVLKSKTGFLPGPGAGAGNDQSAGDWPRLAELLDTLLESDLADLDKLKKADAGAIIERTGGRIFVQLRAFSKLMPDDSFARNLDHLASLRVALINSSADRARVEFSVPGEAPAEYEFIRVEGKWIPTTLANEWIEKIGQARARLSLLSPETFAEQKPQYLALLAVIDGALDRLAAAQTQDAFNSIIQEARLAVFPAIAALVGPPLPAADDSAEQSESNRPITFVTVVVKGMLDDEAQNALRDRLRAAVDQGARSEWEITSDDETTTIRIGPVSDIETFSKRLDFLKVLEIDAKGGVIVAEPGR